MELFIYEAIGLRSGAEIGDESEQPGETAVDDPRRLPPISPLFAAAVVQSRSRHAHRPSDSDLEEAWMRNASVHRSPSVPGDRNPVFLEKVSLPLPGVVSGDDLQRIFLDIVFWAEHKEESLGHICLRVGRIPKNADLRKCVYWLSLQPLPEAKAKLRGF